MTRKAVEVYTDGSCLGNPGPGGWAFLALRNGREVTGRSGSQEETTNNQMELWAVQEALRWVRPEDDVIVYSDSLYVINLFIRRDVACANLDLVNAIRRLLVGRQGEVWFEHVPAHKGQVFNERVDRAARQQAVLAKERSVKEDARPNG
mgnify:CR=1 FL=1